MGQRLGSALLRFDVRTVLLYAGEVKIGIRGPGIRLTYVYDIGHHHVM